MVGKAGRKVVEQLTRSTKKAAKLQGSVRILGITKIRYSQYQNQKIRFEIASR